MKSATVLLFTGIIGFMAWLTLCFTNPWAGFVTSLFCFIGLVGFIIFILACYVIAARSNKHAQAI